MYANIAIQLVTFVSVGLKVVKSGGNIWGEEYTLVFFSKRVSTPTPSGVWCLVPVCKSISLNT